MAGATTAAKLYPLLLAEVVATATAALATSDATAMTVPIAPHTNGSGSAVHAHKNPHRHCKCVASARSERATVRGKASAQRLVSLCKSKRATAGRTRRRQADMALAIGPALGHDMVLEGEAIESEGCGPEPAPWMQEDDEVDADDEDLEQLARPAVIDDVRPRPKLQQMLAC
eukprot:CAMPEP_0179111864 /NCGR_PEP_ID=MMETSP0796-20121207/52266_1 /TAXON_ID=73915 /ORGANISM="Pyrodinium bahamense, Strain pbaha01" /LENGTH=171 /DNA_ID=CAMNT_0020810021 /DNA_START=169 /DNA_END=687 /DNA_ORIENTATION=+